MVTKIIFLLFTIKCRGVLKLRGLYYNSFGTVIIYMIKSQTDADKFGRFTPIIIVNNICTKHYFVKIMLLYLSAISGYIFLLSGFRIS